MGIKAMTEETVGVHAQVIDKISTLMASAFGFVAALAWNDAIKKIFDTFLPVGGDALAAMLLYAVIVTVIAVVATIWIARLAKKTMALQQALVRGTISCVNPKTGKTEIQKVPEKSNEV